MTMQIKKEIVPNDREHYEIVLKRLEALYAYFGDFLKSKEIGPIYSKLLDIKRDLSRVFLENLGDICKECNGNCCKRYVVDLIGNEDYLIMKFFNFDLPIPDWEYLEKRRLENGFDFCLFLGEEGCRLKEFRPFYCLSYIAPTDCDPGMKRLDNRRLSDAEPIIKEYRKYSFK